MNVPIKINVMAFKAYLEMLFKCQEKLRVETQEVIRI